MQTELFNRDIDSLALEWYGALVYVRKASSANDTVLFHVNVHNIRQVRE